MVSPEVFRLSLRHLGHRTRKRLVHGPGPREQAAADRVTIKIGQVAKEGHLKGSYLSRLSVIVGDFELSGHRRATVAVLSVQMLTNRESCLDTGSLVAAEGTWVLSSARRGREAREEQNSVEIKRTFRAPEYY